MINITLKDGTIMQVENGATCLDVAKQISAGLARAALAAEVDGQTVDLKTPLEKDCTMSVLTFDDDMGKWTLRHTASHVLAQAVKHLYPDVKLAIGPAIDNGFYYDIDSEHNFTPEDLEKIEAEMKKIVKQGIPMIREEVSREDALNLFREKNEPYKVELIEDLPEGELITLYHQGDFTDLCAGPHCTDTSKVKAFKLTSCTGAYWRGDEHNKMLQRIYGTAFPKKTMLDEYLAAVEEAKKRDHNKLGRELEYFTTVETLGQGLPVMLPKGARVIQLLQRWVEDVEQEHGYLLTKTPLMAKREFFRISGHWDHYLDGMFVMGDPADETKECFALRPMTCPFQYQVFLNRGRSYRDLPMRLGETSTLFRNEDSGEMHGLIRVRQFTISEGHLVLRPDQLEEEFKGCLDLAKYCLGTVGLLDKCTFRFSQWDPANPNNKYEGTKEQWDHAQSVMERILKDLDVDYTVGIDEAAFYGPKLDFHLQDSLGRTWQCGTIQLDMQLPERFELEYTGADGEKHRPVMIHRVVFGSIERFIGVITEHFAGAFPVWLSPVQVKVMPITDRAADYAKSVAAKLDAAKVRVETDLRNEKIGYKIREAQMQKIPYMLVVGDKEAGTVSVRTRAGVDLGAMPLDEFMAKIGEEISTRSKD